MNIKLFTKRDLFNVVLALLIFAIDLQIPLGVAGGVPYIAVILLSHLSKNIRSVIYFAVFCTFLTLLGFYFSPSGGELWKVISNRALALFAIWTSAILTYKWKIHQHEMLRIRQRMEQEKQKIYMATIKGAQHITNNLLNQLLIVQLEIEKHPEFDKEVIETFNDMTKEANSLMKKLSSVKEISDENIIQSVYPK
jgi:hypothetical protein